MRISRPEDSHISFLDPTLTPMIRGSLRRRSGKYGICTNLRIKFFNSSCPYLPFDITIALVKMLSIGIGRPEASDISFLDPILPPMTQGSLRPYTGKYSICTD